MFSAITTGCAGLYRIIIAGQEVANQAVQFGNVGGQQDHILPIAVGLEVAATGGTQNIRASIEVAKVSGPNANELHVLTRRMCAQSFAR